MKTLPITLCGCVVSSDIPYLKRTITVLHWCQKQLKFAHSILFCHVPPPIEVNAQVIQIPKMDLEQYGIWFNHGLAPFIQTPHMLHFHEDGFVLDGKLWQDEFLKYDYLGAPWRDGVVGNGGFSLQSRKLLDEVAKLPFTQKLDRAYDSQMYHPSDVFVCRVHRKELESRGIKFAPRQLAMEFSAEQLGSWPSLGFHGKKTPTQFARYWRGWSAILQSEAKQ